MEIHLDGGEISVIKAIGLSGGSISGETLMERLPSMERLELVDTLKGLIMFGYVVCDTHSFREIDEFKKADFHVNSGYARELKFAINPSLRPKKSRRVRRE